MTLYGVSCTSPTSCVAVGGLSGAGSSSTLIESFFKTRGAGLALVEKNVTLHREGIDQGYGSIANKLACRSNRGIKAVVVLTAKAPLHGKNCIIEIQGSFTSPGGLSAYTEESFR